jgi:ABC-type branched-subunit amino acid transport system substrate-binding protein
MQRRAFVHLGGAGAAALVLPRTARPAPSPTVKVAMLIPITGPAALFGPSCTNCSVLAAEEINQREGLAGRRVELLFGDAGASADAVHASALKLWQAHKAEAAVGMHDSAVRAALVDLFRGRIAYVYTPTYEGGECAKGTYLLGETPDQQLQPVIPWLARARGLKRWYFIGNDYAWPRRSNAAARVYVAASGGTVVGEEYLPFSTERFDNQLAAIKASAADAVLITLVGAASVGFNRAFAAAGLAAKTVRLGTLIEENTLAGIGAASSANLYSSAGYFASLQTTAAKAFAERYARRFGADAPVLNVLAQSCYEGLLLLEAMTRRAGSTDVDTLDRNAQWLVTQGPRGITVLHNRHAVRDIYVAQAEGTVFRVVKTFEAVRTGQDCNVAR